MPVKIKEQTQRKRTVDNLNPSAHSTTALILPVSLHSTVSLFMFRFRDSQTTSRSLFFFFPLETVEQILVCPPLHSPLCFRVTGTRLFWGFMRQEKRYLCVQILTNVCLCSCCLSATVEGWAGFRILNKLLFSFHTLFVLHFVPLLSNTCFSSGSCSWVWASPCWLMNVQSSTLEGCFHIHLLKFSPSSLKFRFEEGRATRMIGLNKRWVKVRKQSWLWFQITPSWQWDTERRTSCGFPPPQKNTELFL